MTYQLNKSQMQALEEVLSKILAFKNVDMLDKLLLCILTKLYKKVMVKLLDLKKKYKITLDEQTELALYIYFEDMPFNPTNYAANMIKSICNKIEKHYA